MTNQKKIFFITVKATLTKALSGEEVSKDIDVIVGRKEEYRYVSQEHVTCEYDDEDEDITLFHKGEKLSNMEAFTNELPFDWIVEIANGSPLQVRVKGFKTVCSSNLLYLKPSEQNSLFWSKLLKTL